jgi:hypothetical protein
MRRTLWRGVAAGRDPAHRGRFALPDGRMAGKVGRGVPAEPSLGIFQTGEPLAKIRFARAVFRIQNSGFSMNSRRSESRPMHFKIPTAES